MSVARADLTLVEEIGILNEMIGDATKYLLRAERHPDDPRKKGDEA